MWVVGGTKQMPLHFRIKVWKDLNLDKLQGGLRTIELWLQGLDLETGQVHHCDLPQSEQRLSLNHLFILIKFWGKIKYPQYVKLHSYEVCNVVVCSKRRSLI